MRKATIRVALLLAVLPSPALADNCSAWTDCYNLPRAALAAMVGVAVLAGLLFLLAVAPEIAIPLIGYGLEAYGLYGAVTGEDLLTGQKLEPWERALGFVPGGVRAVGMVGKVVKPGLIGSLGRSISELLADEGGVITKVSSGTSGATERTIGSLYRTISASEANAPFITAGQRAPYLTSSRVREITTASERRFLRVDAGAVEGRWLVEARDIEGLTPAQIKERLALPSMPTHVSDVIVPSGARLRIGVAAPQEGWGAGLGTQIRVETVRPSEMKFLNRRPIQ